MASFLVTGTSRGLGLAMVTHLAKEYVPVAGIIFAAARTQTSGLEDLIAKSSGRVVYIEMDTTNPASVEMAVETSRKYLGGKGLDYLVNNAGLGGFAPGWTESL